MGLDMSITEWKFAEALICLDIASGNALAHKASPFTNDVGAEAGTFSADRALTPNGYYAEVPAKSNFHSLCQAIKEDAPYSDTRLNYIRDTITEAEWNLAKSIIIVDGYKVVSDDGTRTVRANFMDNHLAAHGYARI